VDGWIRVHGCDTAVEATTTVDGLPVTSLARTAVDMSASRSLRSSVVFMDAAMRRAIERSCGPAALRAMAIDPTARMHVRAAFDAEVAFFTRHRWVTHVREAIRLADPASETVLESFSRLAMIDGGIAAPRCGVPVVGDDGRTYWADFYWDALRLIGEADGVSKYSDASVLVAEKRREEALRARGFAIVRWGMAEVLPSAQPMLARVRDAMVRAARRHDSNSR
jgi:hypothetical protein